MREFGMYILRTVFIFIFSIFTFFAMSDDNDLEALIYDFRVIELFQFAEFLNQHGDINALDEQRYTLLHKAVFMPHEKAVRLLLEEGADLNIPLPANNKRRYPEGKPLIVELLERGPQVPLEIVELLFQYGLDIHVYDYGVDALDYKTTKKFPVSPLNYVIGKHHQWDSVYRERWIQLLIDNMDIDWQDRYGNTALHETGSIGDIKTARLLVQAGAKKDIINNAGQTPVQMAKAMSGSLFGSDSRVSWYWYYSFFGSQHQVIRLLQSTDKTENALPSCRGFIKRLFK